MEWICAVKKYCARYIEKSVVLCVLTKRKEGQTYGGKRRYFLSVFSGVD